jgi:hypothetical protein
MSSVLRLPSVPGVRLALPLWPGSGGRPAWRRRAALGLMVLVLAAVAVLVATGRIGQPGAGSATAVPGRQASPHAAATEAARARAEAQLRSVPRASEARPASDRVVAPRFSTALFAQHSWFVLAPAPKPAPPPPPPEPTAPPFPYTFVGSFAPDGDPPVFFLARADRVIDAHVGDRLDGVYQFESAAGGQLVFVYLPLNVRQNLAAGAPK